MDSTKRYLYWLLEGTRGGPTRIRILAILAQRPLNLRQLALTAKLDYSTVEHHIHLLEKHSIVERVGEGYGHLYALCEEEPIVRDYVREKIKGGET
jgi:DNA-binding transcriptional ArsR family regulator